MKDKTINIQFFVVLFCILLYPIFLKAQLPTAKQIANKMRIGLNIGNTLECPYGETGWGAPKVTQLLIDSIKAAGFNSVRLPCAWYTHSDTTTNIINAAWLTRVKEVVNYCIKDSLYVMLNIHWDSGWLENRVTVADSARVNKRLLAYWTQIANTFKNHGDHLLFACANEPNSIGEATGRAVFDSYVQTFIKAVRATGANNSSRTLIYQGEMNYATVPKDQIADRLMFEVHNYPYQLSILDKDKPNPYCGGCGDTLYVTYYWGKGNHSLTDLKHNPTYNEEADVDNFYKTLKTRFVDKGVPVILGEYSAGKRGDLTAGADTALHHKSVEYFHYRMVKGALLNGAIPFRWDTPGGIINRKTGAIQDWGIMNAMKKAAAEAEKVEAPEFKDASVNDMNPKQIQVVLSKSVVKSNSFNGFTLRIDNTVVAIDSVVLCDTNKVTIHIGQNILKDNAITVSYSNGNVVSTSLGKQLINFTDTLVNNLLIGASPQMIELKTTSNGDTLLAKFNMKMQIPSDVSTMALNAQYNEQLSISILQGSFFRNDSSFLSFPLSKKVFRDYKLSFTYSGNNITSAENGLLKTMTDFPVTNNANSLPVHINAGKIAADGITLTLEFSKPMLLPSVQSTSLIIKVNGNNVGFKSYIVSNNTIQFTLLKNVHYGDSIKLNYTPGAVTATDNGKLDGFSNFTISNPLSAPILVAVPGIIEAENFALKSGMQVVTTGDVGGGQDLGNIGDGNWAEYAIENNTIQTISKISFRLATTSSAGIISFYLDDKYIGKVNVPNTGNMQVYQTVVSYIYINKGKHYLKAVATKGGFNLNYMEIQEMKTDLSHVTDEKVCIYPNPVSTELNISATDFQHKTIQIFDVMGRLVSRMATTGESFLRVPVDLSDGIYFIKIGNETHYQLRKFMVVNK